MKPKLLKMLLSLGLAIVLWIYVVTTVSPETDMNFSDVPVMLQGEALLQEVGYMVTDMDVSSVDLRLQGSRMELERIKYSDIRITLDVSKTPVAGTHELPYSVSFTGDVDQGAIAVISKYPSTINVTVEPRESKPLDIEVDFLNDTPSGFKHDEANMIVTYNDVNVSQINISGPESIVGKEGIIQKAKVSVDLKDRTETFIEDYDIILCDKDGNPVDTRLLELVELDVKQVTLTLKILTEKDLPVVPQFKYGGGATTDNTKYTCNPGTIKVSGSAAMMQSYAQIDLEEIDLSQYKGGEPLVLPIKLPDGINNESDAKEVQVEITFDGLTSKTVTVSDFIYENLPDGLHAEVEEETLEIFLRGSKDAMAALKKSDIMVKIDLTGAVEGETEALAIIEISDVNIGVVGSYKLKVKITRSTAVE